jgi:UDP-2-acetamido-2,6-beta-L-arabino-hexul-4-ose reductase
LLPEEFSCIDFKREFFDDNQVLDAFVSQCDVIVHLAAMNRHEDAKVIYKTNIDLVKKLIASLDRSGNQPHLLISSSSQEERDNLYGRSKKLGRELFIEWAENIPNLIPNKHSKISISSDLSDERFLKFTNY